MRFCTNCGARLGDGDRFCVQCGQERDDWPVQSANQAVQPVPAPQQVAGAQPGAAAPQAKGGKGNRGLIIAIGVAAVVAVALVGALLWVLVIHPRTAAGVGGDAQSSAQTQAGADDQQGGDAKESKACDKVPDFAIKSHTMHDTDLVVKLTVTASCGTDSVLKLDNDAVRITVKDGDDIYADAVYDFSSDPVSAKAGEDGEAMITFVKSQYWFIPDQASWSDLTVTGELDAEAQGGKASAGNADDVTGADAMDQNEREQVAKAAINRQIAHDKSAVSDLGSSYTTQLSSKQLNMQADGKTWTYQDIWQQFADLKAKWPNTVFLWSGDWPKYQSSGTADYYVILSGERFGSVDDGWNWCSANNFGKNDCMPISVQ